MGDVWSYIADVSQHVLRGAFLPLWVLAAWASLTLFQKVVWPAAQQALNPGLSAAEQCRGIIAQSLGIGCWFWSLGVLAETTIYGLVRWEPIAFGWLNTYWPAVAAAKASYVVGLGFVVSASVPEHARCRRLWWMISAGGALWVSGAFVSNALF